jgi:putative heme transporter
VSDLGDSRERPAAAPVDRRRLVWRAFWSLALVVVIFTAVLPRIADFSDVWREVRAMTTIEISTLLVLGVWNLVTYSFVLVPSLPGLRFGQAVVVTQAATAVANTLPGGGGFGIAVAWAMYSSWGFSRPAITLSLLVTGVWNIFAKLGFPVVALALLAVQGDATAPALVAAGAGVAMLVGAIGVFAVLLRTERGAQRVGAAAARVANPLRRLLRRPPVTDWSRSASEFRRSTNELLSRRWPALTAGTIVSHFSLYLVLLVTLRHVGVAEADVSWTAVLAAYAFVRLVSALPVTPGGLGVVELGLTAALVAAGGDRAQVVAAVLVYRALTFLLQIPLGGLAYLVWRRHQHWRGAGGG